MGLTVLLSGSLSLMRSSPAYFFRATSGATHHGLHIPAVTLEAGPHNVAEPAARDAASAAIHNVMAWSGMLPGTDPIDVSKITSAHLNLDNLHRELSYPVVRKRGIVDLVVPAGAAFATGDLLANVRSIDGRLLEELRADFDGHVLSWSPGVVRMEGESLGSLHTPPPYGGFATSIAPWKHRITERLRIRKVLTCSSEMFATGGQVHAAHRTLVTSRW